MKNDEIPQQNQDGGYILPQGFLADIERGCDYFFKKRGMDTGGWKQQRERRLNEYTKANTDTEA